MANPEISIHLNIPLTDENGFARDAGEIEPGPCPDFKDPCPTYALPTCPRLFD